MCLAHLLRRSRRLSLLLSLRLLSLSLSRARARSRSRSRSLARSRSRSLARSYKHAKRWTNANQVFARFNLRVGMEPL